MKILAIESSCDETAAAVIADGTKILSNVVASSHDMHETYGGIVPEVAARAQAEYIIPVISEALKPLQKPSCSSLYQSIMDEIDALAVSVGPGLIGSLLVGVETAKTIALVTDKPLIPVNHVLAHMYANFIQSHQSSVVSHQPKTTIGLTADDRKLITFPAISLVVSGGHTELYLMKNLKELTWLGGTLDDAAGECFDKTARLLGFGNGGGLAIQQAATQFNIRYSALDIHLPRPMLDKDNQLNFSFSGLKTAIVRAVNKLKEQKQFNDNAIHHLAYEVQETITDILVKKTLLAADRYKAASILLSGGVSANLRLRKKFTSKLQAIASHLSFHVPPVSLCTDNAAYIASYAYFHGTKTNWRHVTAVPDLSVEIRQQSLQEASVR